MSRKYALDADHNLIPGDELTFAYSGSGVATLVDAAGTGYKVAVGARNLAGIDGENLILNSDVGDITAASEPTDDYDELASMVESGNVLGAQKRILARVTSAT
jgi:hypothetical protein